MAHVVTAQQLTAEVTSEARPLAALLADFASLTKPRLSLQVLITAAGGAWLSGHTLDLRAWVFLLLGTAGTIAAANTLNCVFERESDLFMPRTATRPLPQGRLSAPSAVFFAALLTGTSLPLLWWVNPFTCALGVVALTSYVFVYTPLKRRTHWAMQVGALPGALPPLMGWVAAAGEVQPGGLSLFAIMATWQMPHFIAIALYRAREYRAAGLHTVVLDKGEDTARLHAFGYTVLQGLAAVSPYFVGLAGPAYLAIAALLSIAYAAYAFSGWWKKKDAAWARRFFLLSNVSLLALFVLLGVKV